MHPLFFIGVALTVVGLIASGDKKKPSGDTQRGDVAPDNTGEAPLEYGEAEVVNDNQRLKDMLSLPPPPGFDDLSREDIRLVYDEDPQVLIDSEAQIATATSRFFKKKGNGKKAKAWRKYAEYLRNLDKDESDSD